jgi:TatD DNase family protein
MARELGLPACVHVRDAGDEARSLVDRVPGVRGWIHCFSEGPAEMGEWTRRGFHVSFAGTVTYPGSGRLREAARAAADDCVLIETDTPYLAPQARRGQRNEPAHVVHTYDEVARERGTTAAQLAEQVRANAAALFGQRW